MLHREACDKDRTFNTKYSPIKPKSYIEHEVISRVKETLPTNHKHISMQNVIK